MLHVHFHVPRLPADARDNRAQPDPRGDRCRKPFDNAIVAIDHAAQPPLFDIVGRPSAFGQRVDAGDSRICGVKPLDPLLRKTALTRETPAARTRIQELTKTAIA